MKNVETKKIFSGDIPILVLQEKGSKDSKGVIFIYHGWSSKKENYHFMGSIYALEGYQVIIPDSVHHGDRGRLDYEKDSVMEENFWKTAIQSVDEYSLIKKDLSDKGILLSSEIAITGNSMGGIISSGIFVKDKDLKTLIVMNGACSWMDVDKRIKENRNIDRTKGINPETLERYDPGKYLKDFDFRPILIQHGEQDKSVPIESQEFFYEKISEYYGDKKDRLRFTKTPNLNHHKTIGMLEESIHWLHIMMK